MKNKYFKTLSKSEEKLLFDGFFTKFVSTEKMTLAQVRIEKGKELPEHQHENEQITTVILDEMKWRSGTQG